MRPIAFLLICAALAAPLAGCNVWQDRAEFAPPQSRWPDTLPSPVAANAPPPPVRAQYCYRTLGTVDCFAQPQPDRESGFTGRYPAQ
jgi:hypothetical protein